MRQREEKLVNILVTGALGTLGQVLVNILRARGHRVHLLDLQHHHDPDYSRCDIASVHQLQRVFDSHDFDLVYNLAAEFGRWNGEDYYDKVWMTNVIGLKNILRIQERKKFRLVHFSSSEVYGDWSETMSEDVMDKHEIRQLNDYAISKWVGEMQCMNSAAMFGTQSVRVRLFNIYGPGELYSPYRSAICKFAYHALRRIPYTVYLNHHRTSLFVTDACTTLANICENFTAGEVYNIGGTEYHDMKAVSDMILRLAGRDDDFVTYQESEAFTTRDKIVDIAKATRDLGHRSTVGLEEGLKRTVDWMQSVYGKA